MHKALYSLIRYGWPFALVLVLWNFSLKYVPCKYGVPGTSGEFGDMFGAINALFSGLAFAGVLVALFMQREDLRKQEKVIEKQNETLARQQFEASFFLRLEHFSKYIDEMEVPSGNATVSGLPMFSQFRQVLLNNFKALPSAGGGIKDVWGRACNGLTDEAYGVNFRPYVKLLQGICAYAKKEQVEQAQEYINIVIDGMSKHELIILFFAGLSDEFPGLKGIIEETGMMRSLYEKELQDSLQQPMLFYSETAFQSK